MQIETNEYGLNRLEWPKARKDMALGKLSESDWGKANKDQKKILHEIELAIQSIDMEDLSELDQ
jgi:hypothetical protein